METAPADQQTEQQPQAPSAGDTSSTLENLVGEWDKTPADLPASDAPAPDSDGKPKPEAAKPDGKPPIEKPEAGAKPPPKLFQAHEALKKTVKTIEQERDQLRAQVVEYEKAKATGANPKEIESLRKDLEATKAELRETAFERSDEYKKLFTEKRNELYKEAVEDIATLTVTMKTVDANGDTIETERAATEADFRRLYFLPPREQDKAIAEMFGPSAARVHAHLNDLARNARDAQAALQRAREDSDGRSKKMQEQVTVTQQNYEKAVTESAKTLQEKWPQWFQIPPVEGDNADKELAEAHTGGLALVKDFKSKAGTLSIEDAAAYSAVIEARAGAWPRQQVEIRRLQEKVKAFEARFKGREASDPGAGGGTKPAGGAADGENDIEGMAKVWDKS